jgi:citronellyl-CoA dehydrogenase
MSSHFSDEHQLFRQTVREFITHELAPHAERWEREGIFDRWVFEKMGALGFLGLRFPEDVGGAGVDYWYSVVLIEELVHSRCAGMNMGVLVQTDMATPVINEVGSDYLRKTFLPDAIAGRKIFALGVTEPGCGSDVAAIRTTAIRDGDCYVINGNKIWITNGTRADSITLLAKTNPDAGHGGMSLIVVPTDTPGFSVSKKLDKLGNRSSDTAELAFDGCRVPCRNLIGEEGMGFYYLMQNFQGERLVAAVGGVAGAERIWQEAVRYGLERQAFGRPIARMGYWKQELARLRAEIEAGRQLAYHACDLFDRKQDCTLAVSMAKAFCCEMANEVIDRCLQVFGGYGYSEEYPVARAFRDMRLLTIGGGTTEVMHEIIAKLSGL